MQNKLDLTNYPQDTTRTFEGANGSKRCLIIDGQSYMVKFPSTPSKNENMSYSRDYLKIILSMIIADIQFILNAVVNVCFFSRMHQKYQ